MRSRPRPRSAPHGGALALLPARRDLHHPYDSSRFVKISISQVAETLIEAVILVFLVMLLFLQNIRYTIIPTIVVPVALLGSFGVLLALGFSINVLTMFGMVLVIGIVVDDAIVVVENVERIMSERPAAARGDQEAMGQIYGAIVGVTVVLIGVRAARVLQRGSGQHLPPVRRGDAVGDPLAVGLHGAVAHAGAVRDPARSWSRPATTSAGGRLHRLVQPRREVDDPGTVGIVAVAAAQRPRAACVRRARSDRGPALRAPADPRSRPTRTRATSSPTCSCPPGATQQRTLDAMKKAEASSCPTRDRRHGQRAPASASRHRTERRPAFVPLKDWSERRARALGAGAGQARVRRA